MLALEQRRSELQEQLDSLVQQLTDLKDHLFDEGTFTAKASKVKVTPLRPSSGKRAKRGALKDQIMSALHSAGAAGVKVKELAEALGTKPVNIHSWFHSALKRTKEISKLTGGHYRLAGTSSKSAAKKAPVVTPAKATPAKAPKAGKGRKRGQLTANILAELKSAGSKGISVADLSKKLGANYKNVYIWFATTGKKQAGVKKIAPATYALTA